MADIVFTTDHAVFAYAAGIIDGEGSIGICEYARGNRGGQ